MIVEVVCLAAVCEVVHCTALSGYALSPPLDDKAEDKNVLKFCVYPWCFLNEITKLEMIIPVHE